LAGNWSAPGGSPNTIDTIENVFIQNPVGGVWSVEVTASEVNQDGHVQTPQLDMDYALVVSGGVTASDCNLSGIDDECDVDCSLPGCNVPGCGQSADCNSNLYPDECDIASGLSEDCNDNDIPDECDIASGVSEDCNNDGIPDDCQLDGNDCDANLVPDDCDEAALAATIAAPANQHPCSGGQAVFNATAPGATGYQWYLDGTVPLTNGGNVSGADTDTLTISSVGPADEGAYSCMVSFGCITVSSQSAALDLTTDDLQVTLVSPSPIQTCASSGAAIAAFEVSVNDATGVSYQWDRNGDDLVNGGNISGANGKRLEINPANGADVGMYTCTVSNACSAQSPTASGELRISASFAQQPPPTVCAEHGTDAVFTAQAADPQPDIFSWFEGAVQLSDGGRISGANTDTLTLSDVQPGDDGRTFRLRLVVADPFCLNFSEDTELNAQPAGQCSTCPTPGDMDGDGDFDLHDYYLFNLCYGEDVLVRTDCACANVQTENTLVDLDDWTALETLFTGPTP
jgi:hypothetical protein